MSGEQLVRQLRLLEAPGAQQLEGEAYDWLFLKAKDNPLATFLTWFIDNVSANNILTDEELNEFEALEAGGEGMSSTQLQEREAALSNMPSNPGASDHTLGEQLPSPEELKFLEDELEVLTMRKNMMNAHKVELREEMYRLNQRAQCASTELHQQVEAAVSTDYHLNKAQQNLAGTVDQLLSASHKFGEAVEFEEWYKEEDKVTDLLTTYIHKQFKEGVGVVAGTEDSSQYVLLDLNKMDLSLVRGAGEEQYHRNLAELRRLKTLLPKTEEWRLSGMILQQRRKAEVEEAERLLAALHHGHLPSDPAVQRQQMQEAQECLVVVEKDFRQQWRAMQATLAEVAELEGTKTISGDYELKLQRQEYFLSKQKIVMDQLVSQAARHNWVIIVLQKVGQRISNLLQVLKMVNTTVIQRDDNYKDRMGQLEAILKDSEERKASGVLPRPLHTLSQLLSSLGQGGAKVLGKEALLKQVENMITSLSVAQQQMATFTSPQSLCLSQMVRTCEVLEASLFGSAGSLQVLPLAWLEAPLGQSCTVAEQKGWEFKQKLISTILQYEKKKTILQLDPALSHNLGKWAADILRKLN